MKTDEDRLETYSNFDENAPDGYRLIEEEDDGGKAFHDERLFQSTANEGLAEVLA